MKHAKSPLHTYSFSNLVTLMQTSNLKTLHFPDIRIDLIPGKYLRVAKPNFTYFGAISFNGIFRPGTEVVDTWPKEEKARYWKALLAARENPKEALAKWGRQTGQCGVCGRDLIDPESVAAGIGPVCAGKLP